jgi:hypothetical protein
MKRALLALLVACSATPAPHEARRAPAAVPISDPPEYQISHVSRDAGEAIFSRTGIGDPYRTGLPYPIFLALLRAYPDVLGADAEELARRFGFLMRAPGDADGALPIGMHLTLDPYTRVPFVVTACALCHTERLRWPGGERLVVGLANKRARVHAYDAAFVAIAERADFDETRLAALALEESRAKSVPWPADYRGALVHATAEALRARAKARAAFVLRVKDGPPGRVAPIESFALALGQALGRDVKTAPDVGWSKIPDVVGFPLRTTLSWDGATEASIDALVVEADFAIGVRPEWNWKHPKQGPSLSAFLRALPRERDLPFPGPIDSALAADGRARFEETCAPCHGTYGAVVRWTERVVSTRVVGTDPARANALTDDFVRAANDPSLTHGIVETRRTGGYVPPVLTSIWARAPYGHAGQWPNLAFLATAPEKRAPRYVVDLDAPLDLEVVGLKTRAPGGPLGPGEHLHDGAAPGLGVQGHPFLADLGGPAARAVIEYLKTL